MQNPLKYTVDEIARMRAAVETLTGSSGAEDRLRTYMQNGTTVAELEKAADDRQRLLESAQRSAKRLQREYEYQMQSASGSLGPFSRGY